MSDRPIEPSDTERSEWPNATREYVEWLEEAEDALLRLEGALARGMPDIRTGDYVDVAYERHVESSLGGKGGVRGTVTKVWRPRDHGAGQWQWQVNDAWCFHAHDTIIEHIPAGDREGGSE